MKSGKEDEIEVENTPVSSLPGTGNALTEPAEQNASEQPLQTVAPAEAVEDIDNTGEHSPAPPTPVTTSAVPVAAA
ncbi:hypothetical protein GGH93_004254 [Coemansia aciculifera]|nr:hypothetical protein GGH93_004254 [Coemansia aciculifera]